MEVMSTFWYLKDLPLYRTTKPYVVNAPLSHIPPGQRTNQDCSAYPGVKVKDIRAEEGTLSLDHNGFALSRTIPMRLPYEDFCNPAKVRDIYCEDVKTTLQAMTGAESARVVHQAVRRRHSSFPERPRGNEEAETDQPVQGVHCDYTPLQALQSVLESFGDQDVERIWHERRVEIIQVWRPLRGPVIDWPLGVCDVTSVNRDSDLVATDNVWTYEIRETYNLLYNSAHTWYYVSNQTSEETLLFKGFDNAQNVSTFCPHAAFQLSEIDDADKMRESVECAILLIYPKKTGEEKTQRSIEENRM